MRFYYGWIILAAAAVSEMLVFGTTSYAGGLFVIPLQTEFGLSRAAANSTVPIIFLGGAFLAPLVGKALDRYSIKHVLTIGAFALAGAFAVIASSSNILLMAFMLLIPAAIGFLALGTVTTGTLVSRWFYKRRGLALGIGAIATSGGGIFVVPVLSKLIASYGWRATLLIEAVVILLCVIPLAFFVLKSRPADMGLESHQENRGRPAADLARLSGEGGAPKLHWHEILGSRNFWGVATLLACISGINQTLVTTFVPYAVLLGYTATQAALLISIFAVSAALTKILGGVLADYVNRQYLMIAAGFVITAAAGILYVWNSYTALAVAAILAGTSLGCVLPSSAAIIASLFGAPQFGTIMGWAYTLIGIASIALVPITGAIFDATKDYRPAFMLFVVIGLAATASTWLVRREKPA